MRRYIPSPAAVLMLALVSLSLPGQPLDAPSTDPGARQGVARSALPPGQPMLRAELVDMEKKAAKRSATVKVEATNVNIVDPAVAGERAKPGEAHFHYQVDTNPVVATTMNKLSFHDLSPGPHLITVTLAGNDHVAVAQPVVLSVRVP
jgi:hypothetical protein